MVGQTSKSFQNCPMIDNFLFGRKGLMKTMFFSSLNY